MLKITTTNGDTLIHADQQSDGMKLTAVDGSQVIVHAGEWGRHKYIRKEGNKYIYPEDLQKENGVSDRKAAKAIAKKDKQFLKEKKMIEKRADKAVGVKGVANEIRETQQMTNAHQGSTAYGGLDSYGYRVADAENAKERIAARRAEKNRLNERKKINQQQDNAHIGYAEDKKKFGDEETSTEELEIQKKKTKARKQQKAAHQGYEADRKKWGDTETSTEELEIQKEKTKQRKRAKEKAANREEYLKNLSKAKSKKSGASESDNRPEGRTRNVLDGSMTIKKKRKIKTSGPVGSR